MKPAFSSWQEFFAMGGYGFFVWLAVAATLIPLLALVFHTWWHRKQLLTDIQRRKSREARIENAKNQKRTTL